jgi:H+/Cl- antiporter ClcA
MSERPRPFQRFIAVLAVLGVLVLGILAASPDLHAWVHHADGSQTTSQAVPVSDADHVCAVTLFANGLLALAVFCWLLRLAPLARDGVVRAVDAIAAADPRYRLLPAQAPPAA